MWVEVPIVFLPANSLNCCTAGKHFIGPHCLVFLVSPIASSSHCSESHFTRVRDITSVIKSLRPVCSKIAANGSCVFTTRDFLILGFHLLWHVKSGAVVRGSWEYEKITNTYLFPDTVCFDVQHMPLMSRRLTPAPTTQPMPYGIGSGQNFNARERETR